MIIKFRTCLSPELFAGLLLNSLSVVVGVVMGRSVKASCHDGDVF